MKKKLTELFDISKEKLTISDISEKLGYRQITNNQKKYIAKLLLKLELDGKVYYDNINNYYCPFPSDFFVVKLQDKNNKEITFKINDSIEKININNTNIEKDDYIIVKKIKKGYKLIKVIGKEPEINKSKEIDEIYSLFDPYKKTYTIQELIKKTNGTSEEIEKIMEELEEENIAYFNNKEGVYQKMPEDFYVCTAEITRQGYYKINISNKIYTLPKEKLNGVLSFDKVLLQKANNEITLVKIIKRENPNIVCEVLENNQIKAVGTSNINIKCTNNRFKDLKLPIGTRFLAKLSNEEKENYYNIEFINVIGHKNDLNAELISIAYNNGFKVHYNEEEEKEAYSLPTKVCEDEKKKRVDLTKEVIFTIDGANTKDMDDAVSIKKLPNGNYELMVSIADVSHYIKYNSPLFLRAIYNTTSLYLIDQVNHMLHPQISNGICSLNPGEERLTKTYKMQIDNEGNVIDFTFFNSVIKSQKKMTYEDCNKIFEKGTIPDDYKPFVNDLQTMKELAQIIAKRRNTNGALDFGNNEIEFDLDDKGIITGVTNRKQGQSEKIIENFMIITNESIAEYMYNLGIEFIYRNHEIPMDEKVEETIKLIKNMGYKLNILSDCNNPHVIQNVINSLQSKEEFFIISSLLIKSMPKAYYSTYNKGHYGLALNAYSQTTSPIRRIMDLMIEYIIDNLDNIYSGTINMDEIKTYLNGLCKRASMMERAADKAEYEANKLYMIDYVINNHNTEFIGYVQKITPNYIVVKTKELIEGIIEPNDIIDGTYIYNPDNKSFDSTNNKEQINIGTKLTLNFKEANREYRILKFSAQKENLTLTRKKKD